MNYSIRRGLLNHFKCRNVDYPSKNGKVARFQVPDDKVPWNIIWPEYAPPYYTSPHIMGQTWADSEIDDPGFHPVWNVVDGSTNRCSYHGSYTVFNNFPQNPVGRTGLAGRGILGKWGPNHAADPILTKWKRDENQSVIYHELSKKPILQFVGIRRRDCGEWALPGGMVDTGETITQTLKREFMEEALNYLEMETEAKKQISAQLNYFFTTGVDIYKGYVDDIRNTDNAWIETVAQNFHDESGSLMDHLKLRSGDDAVDVMWIDISSNLDLYASHTYLIKLVVTNHNAHW
ncbi:ADP-ribose pyrophosphatase, mitochondrial [Rhodnius prolixus]|uniref:Putative transient receptor potential-related channel 7 n=2 Tax=Rhodnius TaxID=13248 RepID=R4FM43_RHOPR